MILTTADGICLRLSSTFVAANNATIARPTWKGKNNTCLSKFNNTFLGKFDNFFSPLSMIPGIGPEWKSSIVEDVGGGAAKYTIFKFFQAAGNNWSGDLPPISVHVRIRQLSATPSRD